jgi:hypothetical protein
LFFTEQKFAAVKPQRRTYKTQVIIAGATLLETAFRQNLALNINKMLLKLSHVLLWLPHSAKATRAAKCRGTHLSLLTGRLALKSYTK